MRPGSWLRSERRFLERRFLRKTAFHEEVVVRGSIVCMMLCAVVVGIGAIGCMKPGPVRSKAMTVQPGAEGDPANTAGALDELNKRTGVKYTK